MKMNKFFRLIRYDWPLHFVLLFTNWLPDNVMTFRFRGILIRPFFKRCGKDLRVARSNVFINSFNMEFGDHVFIAHGNWFSAAASISVGNEVMFGPGSVIVTLNHTKINSSFRYGPGAAKAISIGAGCWIGGNSSILSGSEIGEGTVVGASTVVRGVVPAHVLFAGNPGKVIKAV